MLHPNPKQLLAAMLVAAGLGGSYLFNLNVTLAIDLFVLCQPVNKMQTPTHIHLNPTNPNSIKPFSNRLFFWVHTYIGHKLTPT